MSSITNRLAPLQGARYRPMPWYDIHEQGVPLVGYGLGEKAPGRRAYVPVAWRGDPIPWKTKTEAISACNTINAEGKQP